MDYHFPRSTYREPGPTFNPIPLEALTPKMDPQIAQVLEKLEREFKGLNDKYYRLRAGYIATHNTLRLIHSQADSYFCPRGSQSASIIITAINEAAKQALVAAQILGEQESAIEDADNDEAHKEN